MSKQKIVTKAPHLFEQLTVRLLRFNEREEMFQIISIRRFFVTSFCAAVLLIQSSCIKDSPRVNNSNVVSTVNNSNAVEATQHQGPQPPFHSYQVKISGPVTLDETWIELHPETYLKADNDLQEVGLELEQPFNDDFFSKGKGPNKGKGILMPDGDVINPEIEVVDQDGNVFDLVYGGGHIPGNGKGGTIIYNPPYPQEFPRDREYKTVRIRSPRPIKCKAVYWVSESVKDWP
ncbi:MAG: hypothetical protein QOC96_2624 [Acidobacteriota bacterium]|jgi:hypothetical protein|nr:hypothetical protein [Acidobacteriota bacterium]